MNSKTRFIQICPSNQTAGGFSLIELMVIVAVLGVLMAAGLPQLTTFLKNSRLTAQTNTFISVLNYARSEAINRGANIFITANDVNDANNEWGKGWKIWIDGLDVAACGIGDPPLPQAPNGILEEDDTGCNEVLKIFDFPGSKVTIDMVGTFADLSAAEVGNDLTAATLMFRGGNGTPALRGSDTTFIEFHICDDRTNPEELGRSIRVNRVTGRVTMFDSAYQCS